MEAEDVLSPARNGKLRPGACFLDVARWKRLMWAKAESVGEDNLTSNRRNHGL
jgi:hypothetical protein